MWGYLVDLAAVQLRAEVEGIPGLPGLHVVVVQDVVQERQDAVPWGTGRLAAGMARRSPGREEEAGGSPEDLGGGGKGGQGH